MESSLCGSRIHSYTASGLTSSVGLEAPVFLPSSAALPDQSLDVVDGNEGEFNVCNNNRTDKLRPPAQMVFLYGDSRASGLKSVHVFVSSFLTMRPHCSGEWASVKV